jgi:3-phosphoshikimate 1-carboxyvinyltransferase
MRALLFEYLSKKTCKIKNILEAPEVDFFKKTLQTWDLVDAVDVKNSGIALQFLIALASLRSKKTLIDGDASIQNLRPIQPLVEAFKSCGVKIVYLKKSGYAPIEIHGPLRAGNVRLSGKNSQHVSALLIAFSLVSGKSTITVDHPAETPYVQMTIDWLKKFGGKIRQQGFSYFEVEGPIEVKPFEYTVVEDFSSAAFLVVVSKLFDLKADFSSLDFSDAQGDKKIFEFLEQKSCSIKETPDLLPILMVAGVLGVGPTQINDIHVARQKESDRPKVMQQELQKMGGVIVIDEQNDRVEIFPSSLKGADLFSHQDHRIAMSLAVAALKADGESCVQGVECVAKSFPRFFETYCPDWIAQVRQNGSGTVYIRPKKT